VKAIPPLDLDSLQLDSQYLSTPAKRALAELLSCYRTQFQTGDAELRRLRAACCDAWVMIANVSGGDWDRQSADWRAAAERWRDTYAVSNERD
jgi:hypothetical protein